MGARAVWVGIVLTASVTSGCGSPPAGVGATHKPIETSSSSLRSGAADGPGNDFEADGATREPRALTPRGSEAWRISKPAHDHEIEAFTTHASGLPGTRVGLKVSTTEGGYEAAAYRIGSYRGGTGAFVWESGFRRGRVQAPARLEPTETRTVVAPWKRDLTVDTTRWLPGFYVFTLRTPTGWQTQVPYVVTSPSARGTVALVAPVTTWQAYNAWGGYSLYEGPAGDRGSYAVSFDRPYNGATGANDYRTAAIPIIVRAEQTGAALSYFTNVDLHVRPGSLDGALGYVSMGHDEYWTPTMRTEVMAARDAGTNLAFLSANTMYWRVRLTDRPTGKARLLTGYRDAAHLDPLRDTDPDAATSRFRDHPLPRPEHDLLGMQYECFPVDVDLVVVTPGWWGFEGTGVARGDRIPGLIGPEADRVYPDATLPRPLQVLGHTPYDCRGVATSAQTIYYTAPSGAGVFNAGTLRWGCALVDRCERPLGRVTARFVRMVTGNLVRGFAEGPVGGEHPARDNVETFHLSSLNTVSAS
jgi:hypothetical protein